MLGVRDTNISIMTRQYIYGYIIGLPFFTLTRILAPYLELEGQFRRVVISSFMMTFIDIAADAFVIFVLKGGMFEIGLAASLGYIVSFLIEAPFFFNRKRSSSFSLYIKEFDAKVCLDMLKLSSTSGIYRASHALGGMAINNLLTSLNMPYLVAAYGVFSQITVYIRSSWSSASSNLLVFSGIFVGEEDRN